ncbi:MAG: [protein-PII] uridylyltransferase [Rhodospirillales bacterium RIFCSPLOWO2_12_FULL_58_28]|nr:MAG: [protein-PII] uridylyltransferase [Rhodospirillales bacterium RIFCSPLOWO2_02_FULL_58_16]OHC78272.1 MAG: [protein-PII] uridylyltransferase [Rhodospirillales bacterium RIFCSPLOWO2_12_FULL_58_28]
MITIQNQHAIIDREALAGKLAEIAEWSGYSSKTHPNVLAILKDALNNGRNEVRRRFESEGAKGSEVVSANAFLVDQLMRVIHDFALEYVYPLANPTTGERLSVAATGGYGRGELAPYSDIDLMFLLPYKRTPHIEQVVEFMLYLLWDMGLKVGHATRSVDESIRLSKEDLTIRTSLLEARWLLGNEALFNDFKRRFISEIVSGSGADFVDEKLAERNARHERMGGSRYMLEPNIKEGKGGLRDLQTLFWIAKYLYQVDDVNGLTARGVLTQDDAKRFGKAQEFLWTVRCRLHYLSGRPEERLSFDAQTVISVRMGYADEEGAGNGGGARGVERFMKDYFLIAKDVGDLTRILCAVLEEAQKKRRFRMPSMSLLTRPVKGFRVDGARLMVENDRDFERDPVKLIRLFHEAQSHGLDIHPQALRLVTRNLHLINDDLRANEAANRLFMAMLTSGKDPEKALKQLNEAGVLGLFITEFGRVVAHMQYDMYHVYTVDEHTIRAIGVLHNIEQGRFKDELPVVSAVIGELQSRKALYAAVLLHDIAKGQKGDHSEVGSGIARDLGPRLGLSEWETETVSWLVLHHLLMSSTAFKRDLDDPKAIGDFIKIVQSPERLRMLTVLTVADIRAVGPQVWNGWKGGLLRELYYRALDEITGGAGAGSQESRVGDVKQALRERLKDWGLADVEKHIERGYPGYWLTFDADTLASHAHLVRKAEQEGLDLHIETRVDDFLDVTEIVIYTADHPGLFSQIAGAMALSGASIVDAKIVTLSNGMALDTFSIQDSGGGAFADKKQLEKLRRRTEETLAGQLDPGRALNAQRRQALPGRASVFEVPPLVLIDNKASANYTVIEVNGRDRLGFLHDVTAVLKSLGLQISSAHVSTYGERVVDVFYVKDIFGLKVDGDEKIKTIHDLLLKAVING